MTAPTRPIRIPAALFGALALLAAVWAAPVRAGQPHETWVAFGDSLTASQRWPWTDLLARETGNTVVNTGHNRGTTRQALGFLEKDVLRRRPDQVFVMFGVNDQDIPNGGAPGGYRVPPDAYRRNLDTIVTRIQGIGARVVLMTNRPLIEGPGAPRASFYLDRHGDGGRLYTLPRKTKDSIQLYNGIVRDIARARGTCLVDIWQAVVDKAGGDGDAEVLKLGIDRDPPLLDGVHLGPGGARFYADTIEAALPCRSGTR